MSQSPTNAKPRMLLACLCGLLAAAPAWALKTDKSQPINIHADHADFKNDPQDNSNGTGIYTGHVVITQGSIVLQGDKAILSIVNNDLSTADITGDPATFVQRPDAGEPIHGEALEITYDAAKDEIVLITNAKLTQAVIQHVTNGLSKGEIPDERLMTADVVHYNTETQHVVAKAGDEDQRVHLSFPPKTVAPASTTAPADGKKSAAPAVVTRAPTILGAPSPSQPTPAPAPTTQAKGPPH